ncbi:hypothetical protein T03_65 [Trichinella britovi]|uniref:Uncharacterized protein n=1 Tax=Trichinella britovi TaxID=45882 RepID=A0A0V1AH70_TRIBR|nr:hypothetical protein T03_65 [Trichinella britovi]
MNRVVYLIDRSLVSRGSGSEDQNTINDSGSDEESVYSDEQ